MEDKTKEIPNNETSNNFIQVMQILRKLANDDNFREQFSNNPQKVFADLGLNLSPEIFPEKISLIPKDDLKKILSETGVDDPQSLGDIDPAKSAFWTFATFATFAWK